MMETVILAVGLSWITQNKGVQIKEGLPTWHSGQQLQEVTKAPS